MGVLTVARGTPQISCENEINELMCSPFSFTLGKGSGREAVSAAVAPVSFIFSHFTLVTVYCVAKPSVISKVHFLSKIN